LRISALVVAKSGVLTNDAPRKRASHAGFRPRQLGPVKAKFLADAAYNARVKDLARTAERNFRLPPLVMDCHHDWALSSFLMPVVETTSAVG